MGRGLSMLGALPQLPGSIQSGGGVTFHDTGSTSAGFLGIFHNVPLLAAIIAFAVAQSAKVFTHYYETSMWDFSRLVGSGGMPSSHTAFVVGLTAAVGVRDGTASSVFAMCVIFSLIVMYDATGVRQHAGRQALVLNIILSEMPADHPAQECGRLRDSLGHTPRQVAVGVVLGVAVGWLVQGVALTIK